MGLAAARASMRQMFSLSEPQEAPQVAELDAALDDAFALADLSRAATASDEALAPLESAGPSARRAGARIDAAIAQFDVGEYPRALRLLAAARADLEHAPDASVQARGDHFEGMIHSRLGEYARARASFERALEARRRCDDGAALATTLHSLGVVELRGAQADGIDADEAATHFERTIALCSEARELARRADDLRLAQIAEMSIASALGGLDRVRDALDRFLALLEATRAAGDRRNEPLILVNAAEAARRCGELAQARTLSQQAVDLAASSGSKSGEQRARLELSRACEALGDDAAALAHYKAHHALERETRASEARIAARTGVLRAEVEAAREEAERLRRMSPDLQRENRALVREAREDPLTGLLDRRALDESLVNALAAARFSGRTLAVVVFDVDPFTSIDDRFRHAAGDAVLQALSATLRAHCRASDVAARIGGEKFVLVLADTTRENAVAVAHRVRRELAARDWSSVAGGLGVTVSAGVALDPGQGSVAALLRDADAALRRAKHEGRDRICPGASM